MSGVAVFATTVITGPKWCKGGASHAHHSSPELQVWVWTTWGSVMCMIFIMVRSDQVLLCPCSHQTTQFLVFPISKRSDSRNEESTPSRKPSHNLNSTL